MFCVTLLLFNFNHFDYVCGLTVLCAWFAFAHDILGTIGENAFED